MRFFKIVTCISIEKSLSDVNFQRKTQKIIFLIFQWFQCSNQPFPVFWVVRGWALYKSLHIQLSPQIVARFSANSRDYPMSTIDALHITVEFNIFGRFSLNQIRCFTFGLFSKYKWLFQRVQAESLKRIQLLEISMWLSSNQPSLS